MSGRAPPGASVARTAFLILAGVAFAYGVKTAYDQYIYLQANKKKSPIRRRNATRRRHTSDSRQNATSSSSTGDQNLNAATAEALSFLDGTNATVATRPQSSDEWELAGAHATDVLTLPPDESITTMLNNAGAAARGNREEGYSNEVSEPQESQEIQENQNVLQLLYLIAEDQAKQQGYIHRGVTCNLCNVMPIKGIRYRCSNCIDFDLCESCEAQDAHPKTHLFYKVRIPAPFLGNPKKIQAPVYPGKPSIMSINLPLELTSRLHKETGIDQPEIEALYEQFKCLASTEFPDDPNQLNGAIDRQTFDKCFVPNNSLRPPPPNLIYDRMFAFFDTDMNGFIGFEEFIKGISVRSRRTAQTAANIKEKHKRVFKAYDLNDDGLIERRDVLRMFRAFYALQKDLVKDLIAGLDDDVLESNQASNIVLGSQPISAAFAGSIPINDEPRPVKTAVEEENDEVRAALANDGNELGRRTETMMRALAEHRRELEATRERRQTIEEHMRGRRRRNDATQEHSPTETDTGNDESNVLMEENTTSQTVDTTTNPEEVPDTSEGVVTIDNGNTTADTTSILSPESSSILAVSVEIMPESATTTAPIAVIGDSGPPIAIDSGLVAELLSVVAETQPGTGLQLTELDIEALPHFDLSSDINTALNIDDEPGRIAGDEERELYYLDDYYRSDGDEDDDDDENNDNRKENNYDEDGMISRRKMKQIGGLEKEEDVGREILCQVVEQGINQLLDMLFLAKEKEGLAAVKASSGSQDEKDSSQGSPEKDSGISASNSVSRPDENADDTKSGNAPLSAEQLEKAKDEVKARSGPGRINEEEFLELMQGEAGRKLSFMSNWIHMGSF